MTKSGFWSSVITICRLFGYWVLLVDCNTIRRKKDELFLDFYFQSWKSNQKQNKRLDSQRTIQKNQESEPQLMERVYMLSSSESSSSSRESWNRNSMSWQQHPLQAHTGTTNIAASQPQEPGSFPFFVRRYRILIGFQWPYKNMFTFILTGHF